MAKDREINLGKGQSLLVRENNPEPVKVRDHWIDLNSGKRLAPPPQSTKMTGAQKAEVIKAGINAASQQTTQALTTGSGMHRENAITAREQAKERGITQRNAQDNFAKGLHDLAKGVSSAVESIFKGLADRDIARIDGIVELTKNAPTKTITITTRDEIKAPEPNDRFGRIIKAIKGSGDRIITTVNESKTPVLPKSIELEGYDVKLPSARMERHGSHTSGKGRVDIYTDGRVTVSSESNRTTINGDFDFNGKGVSSGFSVNSEGGNSAEYYEESATFDGGEITGGGIQIHYK